MLDTDGNALLADIREASLLLRKDRRPDALLIYHDVKKQAGRDAVVRHELGQLCEQFGDVDEAITHYRVAAEEAPDIPYYLSALGIAYLNSGELDAARETLEQAMNLKADMPEVLHGLGIYAMRRADYLSAVDYLERSARAKPGDASVRINLAMSLTKLNQHERALEHARKAVKLDNSDAGAQLALCTTLTEIGQLDEAVRHLEAAVRKNRSFGPAYDLLARIKKFSPADDTFIGKAEKVLDQSMPAHERYTLHYALGKMHDDCGRYEEAFAHYRQANTLQRKDYDSSVDQTLLRDMKKAFTAAAIQTLSAGGHASAEPVFIVGMPRSGTTLMEQMIASHPLGAGAGELPEIPRLAGSILPAGSRRKIAARARAELTADRISEHAEHYLSVLRQGQPDAAERIVDKMPSNFFFVGLIHCLFPNATVIHAIRHPLDICLSCYFQSFAELPWSNDFMTIARMYGVYRDAMDYWHRVLPAGKILDVHYEQLVDDTDAQARRMISGCGLPWDDQVLDFYEQKRVVKTASIAQSRQPIYKSSKKRWMNYAPHLSELANELQEYLVDDREKLAEFGIRLRRRGSLLKRFLN